MDLQFHIFNFLTSKTSFRLPDLVIDHSNLPGALVGPHFQMDICSRCRLLKMVAKIRAKPKRSEIYHISNQDNVTVIPKTQQMFQNPPKGLVSSQIQKHLSEIFPSNPIWPRPSNCWVSQHSTRNLSNDVFHSSLAID